MSLKFSCLIDNKPLLEAQAYILINSLLSLAHVNTKDVYVHTIKKTNNDFYSWLESLQLNIIEVSSFDKRNKYCNKLAQLDTFTAMEDEGYVFLLDCDTAVLSLNDLDLSKDVYAKIVDFPLPEPDILKQIFKEAHLSFNVSESSFKINKTNITDANNCNGGLYIMSFEFLKTFAPKWKEYAIWCIENKQLFTEKYSKHADQVGFALAMSSLNKKTELLSQEWNYPLHVNKELLTDVTPNIIHFHDKINEHMQIPAVGLPNVDTQIEKINELISARLSQSLDNSLFWNLRYALYPELGSGVGSRGGILALKKRLISHTTYPFKNSKIIDVGCGDLELTKSSDFTDYTGLDVSQEALKIGKTKRPDWEFVHEKITSPHILEADVIMCFDVLIHQSRKTDFKEMVKSMVEKANKRVIIGAYNQEPQFTSNITHFYNGIFNEINQYNKFNEIAVVLTYRDVSVVVATKHNSNHQRDISSSVLNKAFKQVNRPDLLQFIVDVSRHHFNFFTSHYPRVFEYTWLLEQLESQNKGTVLDLGAGVCPLPLCLAEEKWQVTTIDAHTTIRKEIDKAQWNEWGFLDYETINPAIKSRNMDFSKFKSLKSYNCIYSISVIEHMPKKSRIKVLKKAASLLKKEGLLLLTIDLIPQTNNLWNLSENKEVEPIERHGNIKSLQKELKSCGFEVLEEHVQREIPDSRTDVYYVKALLKKKSVFSQILPV